MTIKEQIDQLLTSYQNIQYVGLVSKVYLKFAKECNADISVDGKMDEKNYQCSFEYNGFFIRALGGPGKNHIKIKGQKKNTPINIII